MTAVAKTTTVTSEEKSHTSPLKYTTAKKMPRHKVLFIVTPPYTCNPSVVSEEVEFWIPAWTDVDSCKRQEADLGVRHRDVAFPLALCENNGGDGFTGVGGKGCEDEGDEEWRNVGGVGEIGDGIHQGISENTGNHSSQGYQQDSFGDDVCFARGTISLFIIILPIRVV